MEMADYWLVDKALVHKLFKVLVPRFENYDISYTKMFKAPRNYPGSHYERTIMELRGNPFPDLIENRSNNRFLIHNVLLDAAKQEFRQQKYAEIAQNMVAEENIVPKEVDPTLIS